MENSKKLKQKTKNHTHVKKAPQNFFLAFIDELEKQLLKKLLKSPNKKNKIILIFTMLHF